MNKNAFCHTKMGSSREVIISHRYRIFQALLPCNFTKTLSFNVLATIWGRGVELKKIDQNSVFQTKKS